MKKHPQSGFTLLELVVTVGIIGLLVAIGVPTFYAYSKQNAPKVAAQDIKGFLLEAQSLSRAPSPQDSGSDFYYVQISQQADLDNNGNQMVLGKGNFTAEGSIDLNSLQEIKGFKFDSDAVIYQVAPKVNHVLSIYFMVPSAQILFNGREPSPGYGYAKICQPMIPACHYSSPYSSAIVQIISSAGQGVSDSSVVVDGNGGNINVVDSLVDLAI